MKKSFLFSYIFLSSFALNAQKTSVGDSVEISFLKVGKVILDSGNYYIKIAYGNIAKRPVLIYRRIYLGYLDDRFSNANVILEKLKNGRYVVQPMTTYKLLDAALLNDSLRHYDLLKKQIPPFEKDTLLLNLRRVQSFFDAGSYRIKINLRVQTIWDTTIFHTDSTGATIPPEDKIKYISSDWMYFQVPKTIYTGNHFHENRDSLH